ncbi:fungal-specific transcription factor domain-containing protein [Hypoxylon sp. FL0890]|nr:fungal-specific transcription factor domain-containing protein [Hypoxylon sp. FL0890]
MSQVAAVASPAAIPGASGGLVVPGSVSSSEKGASVGPSPRAGTSSSPAGGVKLRSCVTCRTRKVRCDKSSPCSNCRRANIPCVFPFVDKTPRWARRLERVTNSAKAAHEADPNVNQVMDRLRNLEGLVKELSSQLEQAHAASARGSPAANSPENSNHDRGLDCKVESSSAANLSSVNSQFGRLVLGDAGQSRYVSSGFWSRVNDELHGLKMDTEELAGGEYDSSEDEDSPGKTPSTVEQDRTPSERHAFLFRHNPGSPEPDLREFHPLPYQIPFLLNVFSENINIMARVVHIPTVNKMIRDLPGGDTSALSPANEALMFAIYYAAITSMEEDDIVTNFGSSKSELNLKYRLGLELALAKADFLNVPDIVLVQAFAIFLFLAKRHDSPRFVWMMTGLAIRMAQALGLHRDGSCFPHLTPFEVEIRRRVWYSICMIDIRASEDQGTDLTITQGSFDTRIPLNINDSDIDPETKETPKEREGITDMTISIVFCQQCIVTQQMMALSLRDGEKCLDEQSRLLNEFYERLERTYLRYSDATNNIAYWVCVTATRLLVAKMSLIIYFPVLFSSTNEHASEELRNKLFIAAIEVAEYNHALNAQQACRHWRWIFQTYTHWYAIVYMLIEATQRPWTPAVERAWVALHSMWLIPAQSTAKNKNLSIWIPLRKLMTKARRHRNTEIERLRGDSLAARRLLEEDRCAVQPASPGPFLPGADSAKCFRERWRQLVGLPEPREDRWNSAQPGGEIDIRSGFAQTADASAPGFSSTTLYDSGVSASQPGFGPAYNQFNLPQSNEASLSGLYNRGVSDMTPNPLGPVTTELLMSGSSYDPFPSVSAPADFGPGFGAWLWADADPSVDVFANMDVEGADFNLDLDSGIDWNNWVESAKGMELSGEQSSAGGWV